MEVIQCKKINVQIGRMSKGFVICWKRTSGSMIYLMQGSQCDSAGGDLQESM